MQRERMTSMIAEHGIESIDIKYSDLIGNWYHLGFPTGRLASVLEHGIPFDGSSVPGMRAVESGDMDSAPPALRNDHFAAALKSLTPSERTSFTLQKTLPRPTIQNHHAG